MNYHFFVSLFFIFEGWGCTTPKENSLKTITGPVGIFPKEQSPIGSVVTEIFRQTDGQMYIFMPSNYDARIFAALYNWPLPQPLPFTDNLPLEKNVCSLLYVRLGLVIKVTWKSKKVMTSQG